MAVTFFFSLTMISSNQGLIAWRFYHKAWQNIPFKHRKCITAPITTNIKWMVCSNGSSTASKRFLKELLRVTDNHNFSRPLGCSPCLFDCIADSAPSLCRASHSLLARSVHSLTVQRTCSYLAHHFSLC